MPEIHYPTPAEAVEAYRLQGLERLATPAELALVRVPVQRRRLPGLPAVVRLGRRTGRSR